MCFDKEKDVSGIIIIQHRELRGGDISLKERLYIVFAFLITFDTKMGVK